MDKIFLNKEGVQVYPPLYPDMTGPGTEYLAGSTEDLAYARGYEDAEADVIAKQSKERKQNEAYKNSSPSVWGSYLDGCIRAGEASAIKHTAENGHL